MLGPAAGCYGWLHSLQGSSSHLHHHSVIVWLVITSATTQHVITGSNISDNMRIACRIACDKNNNHEAVAVLHDNLLGIKMLCASFRFAA
jgi:hypothetical protein